MPDAITLKNAVLMGSAVFLSVMIFVCLMRSALGPRYTDRIIAAGVIGTRFTLLMAVLAVMIGESYLVYICLICSAVSFLAFAVLGRSVLEYKEDTEE